MTYINPFDLLKIKSENLSGIDSSTIRKAKRTLLADIELSDNSTINHHGIELTKSDCIRVIDELDNEEKKEFHFFVFQNPDLNSFLTKGDLRFFKTYKVESIYKLPEFLDFVSPFFIIQFDKQLCFNYKEQSINNVKLLLSVNPLVREADKEICFKSTYQTIKEIENEIIAIEKGISNKVSPFIKNDFDGLASIISKKVNVDLLNLLPIYFQPLRNSLAMNIRWIARDIHNEPYEIYKPAFEIISIAYSIETEGLNNKEITKAYYTIKRHFEESIDQPINSKTQLTPTPKFNVSGINDGNSNKNSKRSDKEVEKESNTLAYIIFLCIALAVGFLYTPIQKIIVGIALLPIAISIWTHLHDNDWESIGRIFKQNWLVIMGGILSFFNPIVAELFLSYYFLGYFILAFEMLTNKRKEKRIKFGFYHYFIGAILITAIYNNFDSISNSITGSQPNQSNSQRSDTSVSNNNSIDTSKKAADTSGKNNLASDSLTTQPTAISYSYPVMENGNIPDCSNITPKFARRINNRLEITNETEYDAAIKLIDSFSGKSVRFIYLHKNSSYIIRNIPQGKYYIKEALGSGWRITSDETICAGRFETIQYFKKGNELFDYNFTYKSDGRYEVPSYSLKIFTTQVYQDSTENTYSANSQTINENEFYNE